METRPLRGEGSARNQANTATQRHQSLREYAEPRLAKLQD